MNNYYSNTLHQHDIDRIDFCFEVIKEQPNQQIWNGAISQEQQNWLKQELDSATLLNQNVILFSHFPIRPKDDPHNFLIKKRTNNRSPFLLIFSVVFFQYTSQEISSQNVKYNTEIISWYISANLFIFSLVYCILLKKAITFHFKQNFMSSKTKQLLEV